MRDDASIAASKTDVDLEPVPIDVGGYSKAHRRHCDETIYIIAGAVVIESATMRPTRFEPGDVVNFPAGSSSNVER